MFNILIIWERRWAFEGDVLSFNEWEELSLVEELVVHKVVKVSAAENSVPIIDNVASVHDLPENVFKIIPWNLSGRGIGLHIVVEYNS